MNLDKSDNTYGSNIGNIHGEAGSEKSSCKSGAMCVREVIRALKRVATSNLSGYASHAEKKTGT